MKLSYIEFAVTLMANEIGKEKTSNDEKKKKEEKSNLDSRFELKCFYRPSMLLR